MRALQVTQFNSPPVITDLAIPNPPAEMVRLKVEACGLNFADLLMNKGEYQATPSLPFTLGMEMAGTIDAVGPDHGGLAVGTRVAAFGGHGGLAEYTLVAAELCVALPENMPFEHAAAFQIAYGTSHLALTQRAQLRKGQTLLVLGAAGGVGLTAVEIGKALGANVIAVARGSQKLAVAQAAGADHLIDATDPELATKLKEFGGADVVYDPVGGDLGESALRVCKAGGNYLVIGFASGSIPQPKLNHLLVKNITLHGFYWGGYIPIDPDALRTSLVELFELYADGKLRPHIGLTAPLEDATEALDALRNRKTTGKVVITL